MAYTIELVKKVMGQWQSVSTAMQNFCDDGNELLPLEADSNSLNLLLNLLDNNIRRIQTGLLAETDDAIVMINKLKNVRAYAESLTGRGGIEVFLTKILKIKRRIYTLAKNNDEIPIENVDQLLILADSLLKGSPQQYENLLNEFESAKLWFLGFNYEGFRPRKSWDNSKTRSLMFPFDNTMHNIKVVLASDIETIDIQELSQLLSAANKQASSIESWYYQNWWQGLGGDKYAHQALNRYWKNNS